MEGGSQKLTIVAFHKNCKSNPILSFGDRYVIYLVVVFFCVYKNWKKWNRIKHRSTTELQ